MIFQKIHPDWSVQKLKHFNLQYSPYFILLLQCVALNRFQSTIAKWNYFQKKKINQNIPIIKKINQYTQQLAQPEIFIRNSILSHQHVFYSVNKCNCFFIYSSFIQFIFSLSSIYLNNEWKLSINSTFLFFLHVTIFFKAK